MTDLDNNPQTEPQTETNPSLLGGQGAEPSDANQAPEQPTTSTAPASIDEYAVEIEGFNFDDFKAIDENKEFLERAREHGLSNDNLQFLLKEYNDLIPALIEGNAALDNETAVQTMSEMWGAQADQNFGYARSAAENLVSNGVLTAEEVNNPSFGNNPLVLKMAAYFGQQLGEDLPPSNTQQSGGADVESLMKSEAYLNESHPDHKRVYEQVQRFYQKQYK